MQLLKLIRFSALVLCLGIFAVACGEHSHDHGDHGHSHGKDTKETTESTEASSGHGEGQAYTAAYVCPMHCEGSGSEKEGKCPACGMNYVAQAEHTKDGHGHHSSH